MSTKLYCTITDGKLDYGSNKSIEWLSENEGKRIVLQVENQTRSSAQNNSIHLYLDQRAKSLDEQGHTMQDVLKVIKKAQIRVTMLALKEIVWKGIQFVMFRTNKTSKLKTDEVDRVYEVCEKFFQTEFPNTGHVPFPSEDIKNYEQHIKDCQRAQKNIDDY